MGRNYAKHPADGKNDFENLWVLVFIKIGLFDLTDRFILHLRGWSDFSIIFIFFKLRKETKSSKKQKEE